jgi:carbon monoxide dehydrogenase subunit G
MPSVTVSVDIEAHPDVVWAAVADLASHGQWMGDVESIEFESEARQGPGTVIRVATKVGPLRTTDVMVITAWEPGRRIAVEHRGLVTGWGEFVLSPVAGATRLTWMENLVFPRRFAGPIGAILALPLLTLIWRRNLGRLKELLET